MRDAIAPQNVVDPVTGASSDGLQGLDTSRQLLAAYRRATNFGLADRHTLNLPSLHQYTFSLRSSDSVVIRSCSHACTLPPPPPPDFAYRCRCHSGQAHCTKCKSTHVCKNCASGYAVSSGGNCVYKCALPCARSLHTSTRRSGTPARLAS